MLGHLLLGVTNLLLPRRWSRATVGPPCGPWQRRPGGRQDPWERYQTEGMLYGRWWGEKLWTMVPAINIVGEFLATFNEYPPSQASGTLSVEKALTMLQEGTHKN